jgi:hypothetical protein
LTRDGTDGLDLSFWLDGKPSGFLSVRRRRRWSVIRSIGDVLRRLHHAGCLCGRQGADPRNLDEGDTPLFLVQPRDEGEPTVTIGNARRLRTCRRLNSRQSFRDISALREELLVAPCSRTDQLRFFLAYLGIPRLTSEAKRQALLIWRARPSTRIRARLAAWWGRLVWRGFVSVPARAAQ